MPEKAVELTLFVYDLVDEGRESDIARIWEIVSENGFHRTPYGDEPQGDGLMFQPFEDTDENRELIEKCIEEIKAEFPDLDVEYWMGKNGDDMKLPEKTCEVTVKI